MENEIKELISYMKEQKEKLLKLYEERKSLKEEKDKIDDKESGFYKDAEQDFDDKVTEYDSIAAETKAVINEKKATIIERLEKDKKAIDKYRKEYKSEYIELSSMHEEIIRKREQLEEAQAHLKWLKATLPDTIEENRETISKAEAKVSELQEEFDESIRIVNLVSEGKNAKETYLGLQDKIKSVENLNINNLEEVAPELLKQEKKTKEKKPEEKKPEEKKPEEKKPEEKKPEEKKPEEEKQEVKKQEVVEQKVKKEEVEEQKVKKEEVEEQEVIKSEDRKLQVSSDYLKALAEYKLLLNKYKMGLSEFYELQKRYQNKEIDYSEYDDNAKDMVESYKSIMKEYKKILDLYNKEKARLGKDKTTGEKNKESEDRLKVIDAELAELWQQGIHEGTPNAKRYHELLEEKRKLKEGNNKSKEPEVQQWHPDLTQEQIEYINSELEIREPVGDEYRQALLQLGLDPNKKTKGKSSNGKVELEAPERPEKPKIIARNIEEPSEDKEDIIDELEDDEKKKSVPKDIPISKKAKGINFEKQEDIYFPKVSITFDSKTKRYIFKDSTNDYDYSISYDDLEGSETYRDYVKNTEYGYKGPDYMIGVLLSTYDKKCLTERKQKTILERSYIEAFKGDMTPQERTKHMEAMGLKIKYDLSDIKNKKMYHKDQKYVIMENAKVQSEMGIAECIEPRTMFQGIKDKVLSIFKKPKALPKPDKSATKKVNKARYYTSKKLPRTTKVAKEIGAGIKIAGTKFYGYITDENKLVTENKVREIREKSFVPKAKVDHDQANKQAAEKANSKEPEKDGVAK